MKKPSQLHMLILMFIVKEVYSKPLNDEENIRHGETQVLRCFPVTLVDLLFLDSLKTNFDYDFWLAPRQIGMPVDIMAGGRELDELKATLESRNIKYIIFIKDVISATDEIIKTNNAAKNRFYCGSGGFFDSYHTYEEIVQWMKNLEATYKGEATLLKLGRSYELRQMYAIKLSRRSLFTNKPAIWIDGGVHAREWISPAVVTYMLDQLLTNSTYDPLLDKIDLYFLPVMNPDGYDYTFTENGRLWRKNLSKTKTLRRCVGVDLNRNWRYHWNNSDPENSDPCSDNYAGKAPFSEHESYNAKEKMMETIGNLKGYLTYHSYAQLFFFPWGYTTEFVSDFADMESVSSRAVSAMYTVRGTRYRQQPYCVEDDLCVYGNSIDYFKGLTGVKYCFMVQLPDLGNYGYLLPPTQIIPVGEESLRGLLVVIDAILSEQ